MFLVRAGYGANMPKQPRSRWAIPLVVLTALWGLVLIVMTAFLIAMSLNGQRDCRRLVDSKTGDKGVD